MRSALKPLRSTLNPPNPESTPLKPDGRSRRILSFFGKCLPNPRGREIATNNTLDDPYGSSSETYPLNKPLVELPPTEHPSITWMINLTLENIKDKLATRYSQEQMSTIMSTHKLFADNPDQINIASLLAIYLYDDWETLHLLIHLTTTLPTVTAVLSITQSDDSCSDSAPTTLDRNFHTSSLKQVRFSPHFHQIGPEYVKTRPEYVTIQQINHQDSDITPNQQTTLKKVVRALHNSGYKNRLHLLLYGHRYEYGNQESTQTVDNIRDALNIIAMKAPKI